MLEAEKTLPVKMKTMRVNNLQAVPLMRFALILATLLFGYFASAVAAEAATLSLSPSTGVYNTGSTFTVRVRRRTRRDRARRRTRKPQGARRVRPCSLAHRQLRK